MGSIKQIMDTSFEMAFMQFRFRNQKSILGMLWYLLDPLVFFLIILLINSHVQFYAVPMYALYFFIGHSLFDFFRKSTLQSMHAITGNSGLINSSAIKQEILVISQMINITLSHFLEILIVMAVMVYFSVPLVFIFWYVPIFVLFWFLTLGVSFVLSTYSVYVADLHNIWIALLHMLWFATPIMYGIEQGGDALSTVLRLNPLTSYINGARELIMGDHMLTLSSWIFLFSMSLISTLVGYLIFRFHKKRFAEVI